MNDQLTETIDGYIQKLRTMQANDGSWRFCFESGPMTDAYTIILLRSLEIDKEEWLIQQLVKRLLLKQTKMGSWKLYPDEKEGNLSATVEAYFALLYSGYVNKQDANIQKAQAYIEKNGGLTKTNTYTKAMLALNGQLPWPKQLKIPIELMLLSRASPISFYDLVGYARIHLTPILIASNLQYSHQTKHTPDLSSLISKRSANDNEFDTEESRFIMKTIKDEINKLLELPERLRHSAITKAEQYMLQQIEGDGLLFTYVSATFYMVYALRALGYATTHPHITRAIEGIKDKVCLTTDDYHIENSTSTIWDTALLSYSLQNAGVAVTDPMIKTSTNYLFSRQHVMYGEWAIQNPYTLPGGWGFSDINTFLPDVDDTTASLRAIKQTILKMPNSRNSWNRGLAWVLSMQNRDGGWAAFEKNTDNIILKFLPFEAAERTLIDPSTADLTGRTMEFLGKHANLLLPHPQLEKARQWIENNQEKDGSWYGRWGICYIYGTWAAITGLKAIGVDSNQTSIKNGIEWLISIQNKDGGWGESCYSDIYKRYVPLHASTPSQTAWALDALIAASDTPTKEIERGVSYLINSIAQTNDYPTGAGIPEVFYIHYHSYQYIWPLLTLGNYRNKYGAV